MTGRAFDRLIRWTPRSLRDRVPRDHWESDATFHRRRRVVAGVGVVGASALGASFRAKPDSREFFGLTFATAATWTLGSLVSGPLHLGRGERQHRPVVAPVVTGAAAFGAFYGVALVARRIPVLDSALRSVLQFADEGTTPLVVLTTGVNGVAEEVFFRGALFAAAGTTQPVLKSTLAYAGVTTATRNPALVLAASAMGTLFGLQRRASGGIQAPAITHLTWSMLMLRFMPPLFRDEKRPVEQRSDPGLTS